jgi:phage gpG-like protein
MLKIEVPSLPRVQRAIERVPIFAQREAIGIFRKMAAGLHRTMVERASGDPLKRRTGELARSWRFDVKDNLGMPIAEVATSSKYARIHEFGGTITPKKAKWLTIPLTGNQTGAGVTKQSARAAIAAGGFFKRDKDDGKLYLRNGQGVPLFVLVKSVTIPPRLGFRAKSELAARDLLKSLGNLFARFKP